MCSKINIQSSFHNAILNFSLKWNEVKMNPKWKKHVISIVQGQVFYFLLQSKKTYFDLQVKQDKLTKTDVS